jgi:hypothetical protein
MHRTKRWVEVVEGRTEQAAKERVAFHRGDYNSRSITFRDGFHPLFAVSFAQPPDQTRDMNDIRP